MTSSVLVMAIPKDIGIDGPTLVPNGGYFFTNLRQSLSQIVSFFLLFELILRAGFFDEMLALPNKKSTFSCEMPLKCSKSDFLFLKPNRSTYWSQLWHKDAHSAHKGD